MNFPKKQVLPEHLGDFDHAEPTFAPAIRLIFDEFIKMKGIEIQAHTFEVEKALKKIAAEIVEKYGSESSS